MAETKTMKGLSFIKRDIYQRTLKSGENVWSSIYRTKVGNDRKDFMFHDDFAFTVQDLEDRELQKLFGGSPLNLSEGDIIDVGYIERRTSDKVFMNPTKITKTGSKNVPLQKFSFEQKVIEKMEVFTKDEKLYIIVPFSEIRRG